MSKVLTKIPEGYEDSLSNYGPVIFDGYCGEPIMWGFEIRRRLGDERFGKLYDYGSLECIYPTWYLVTKKITRKEAIKKYGKVTNEEFGPRGGWKSVTLGEKKFMSRELKV